MINIWMLKFQRLQTVLNNGKHLNGGFDSHHFHHEMKDRLRAVFSFHEGKMQGIEAMEWVRNSHADFPKEPKAICRKMRQRKEGAGARQPTVGESSAAASVHFHHEMKDRLRAVFSFHEGKKQGIEAMEWVRNSGSVKNIEVVDTKKMARCLRAILIYFLESEKVKSN